MSEAWHKYFLHKGVLQTMRKIRMINQMEILIEKAPQLTTQADLRGLLDEREKHYDWLLGSEV